MKKFHVVISAILFFSFFGAKAAPAGNISVFVSILPQKYFVEQIGKNKVDVSVMVLPGANPAVYEPRPRQMAKLSKAKIYFATGVPFESVWMKKFASVNPGLSVIRTQKGIEKFFTDKGKKKQNHEKAIKDPHIWLSPPLVMIQARNILTGLLNADPVNKNFYIKNYKNFIKEAAGLDMEILSLFSKIKNHKKFMVYHPSWGYFAKAYGLKMIPIENRGRAPGPAMLKSLITEAEKNNIKTLFVQPQFSKKSAEMIARAIKGKVVAIDPLSPDWASNLKDVALKIADSLK